MSGSENLSEAVEINKNDKVLNTRNKVSPVSRGVKYFSVTV